MVLVTGANGFLGSYLLRVLLRNGEKVRGLTRVNTNMDLIQDSLAKIELMNGDVLDIPSLEDAMDGVEKVYHCAAVISMVPEDAGKMLKVNIEGAANVMNVAMQKGVKRVVHVSSIAALGLPKDNVLMDENFLNIEDKKNVTYSISKHYGEREAWRAYSEGLDVVVAAPGTIMGAGKWTTPPNSLFTEVYNGLSFYTDGNTGWVDVRDVAEALYILMEKGTSGEKYLLTNENLSFKQVLGDIAILLGKKPPTMKVNSLMKAIAWRGEWIKGKITGTKPVITEESLRLADVVFNYSGEKFKKQFGFSYKPFKQTLADTCEAYIQSTKQGKDYGVFI